MNATMVAVAGGEVWADDSGVDGRVSALVLLCPGIPGFPESQLSMHPELVAEYGRAQPAGDVEAMVAVMQRIWAAAGPTPDVLEQLRSAARADLVLRATKSTLARVATG